MSIFIRPVKMSLDLSRTAQLLICVLDSWQGTWDGLVLVFTKGLTQSIRGLR